jgi:galactose-1-phosphate uridylyltransferase
MDNTETKQTINLVYAIKSAIQKAQDYSDEDMSYIINTEIKVKNNVFYVRMKSSDINLDFVIRNPFSENPDVVEVEFADFDNSENFTKIL